MPFASIDAQLPVRSPLRVFALVLLLVFVVEGTIMLFLPLVPPPWRDSLTVSLLDASLLTLCVAPAVWFLAVLPLRRLFEARGRLLRRLFESQEHERARVARDLHDGVGQQLTALMVGLRNVEAATDLDAARLRARELRAYASRAHGEVRMLARGLRPTVLEALGLASALERLCEDVASNHTLKVELKCDAATLGRLSPDAETALYRIAQEALANVVRHAGAREVTIDLARTHEWITLSLRDDGCGFDGEAAVAPERRDGGFGLGSMRERAEMLGGELSLATAPGRGTTISARVRSCS